MFFCEICEIFKNTCFEEHLRIAAGSLSTTNFATSFSPKIFQPEMAISVKRNFFGKTLATLETRSLYITFIIFFFLEYHEFSEHCS